MGRCGTPTRFKSDHGLFFVIGASTHLWHVRANLYRILRTLWPMASTTATPVATAATATIITAAAACTVDTTVTVTSTHPTPTQLRIPCENGKAKENNVTLRPI